MPTCSPRTSRTSIIASGETLSQRGPVSPPHASPPFALSNLGLYLTSLPRFPLRGLLPMVRRAVILLALSWAVALPAVAAEYTVKVSLSRKDPNVSVGENNGTDPIEF